ncbi:MAG: iron-containing alcohol dehydrogenase [Clostridia bacterium]|nr:iron-containing alcohol dehydrogenase [Clostridia bacterium]
MNGNFTLYTPTKVVFGRKTEQKAGELVRAFGGSRVLIHYGGHSALRSGLIDRVKTSLDEAGIFHVELGGVVPNPQLDKVYEGIELAKANGVDFILAVGGGSVIDSAKAIAYALAEPEFDVKELYEHTRQAKACFPVGTILTIAASGSEMSDSSVISYEDKKRGYNSDLCRPKFAIMDPELTLTLPDYQTCAGCSDILMHTMERYFTTGSKLEITDALAEGLLRTVMKYAAVLHEDPTNYEARAEVMWAGSLSHNGLTGCGNDGNDFASHRLEHELGALYGVTHGAGLTAVWPSWAKYVYKNCLPRFVRFARNVMCVEAGLSDEDTALEGIAAMEDYFRSIGMPVTLKELLGKTVSEEEIRLLAKNCALATGGKVGSAMVLYEEDMANIYRMAKE